MKFFLNWYKADPNGYSVVFFKNSSFSWSYKVLILGFAFKVSRKVCSSNSLLWDGILLVISEMLNFGTSSGEIVVIDKDYKFIGSIETM